MTDTPQAEAELNRCRPWLSPVPAVLVWDTGLDKRVSTAWVGVIVGALVLVLLLVFILQNTRTVKISYFTATGTMPLGVALLLPAMAGVLLSGVVGSLRIWQLRHLPTRKGKSARPIAVEDQSLADRAA